MSVGIVADDFGYCPNRNRAIVHAFRAGAITDTSLLVNANYADAAVTMASKCKLPMGKSTTGFPADFIKAFSVTDLYPLKQVCISTSVRANQSVIPPPYHLF